MRASARCSRAPGKSSSSSLSASAASKAGIGKSLAAAAPGVSSKSGSASAPSSTDMGATATAAASSFIQPKPVFGRREGKRRLQQDRKPAWSDFDQRTDILVWTDTPPLLKTLNPKASKLGNTITGHKTAVHTCSQCSHHLQMQLESTLALHRILHRLFPCISHVIVSKPHPQLGPWSPCRAPRWPGEPADADAWARHSRRCRCRR